MKSLVLLGASALFLLSACGGDSESTSGPAKSTSADMEVSTYDGLPSCAEKREGKTAYVKDQEQGYVCQNGKWVEDDDAVIIYSSSSEKNPLVNTDSFTDSRDGKKYRTVTLGYQIWMAENLNYQVQGSYCYDDNPANCNEYGRLYEYDAAENACPSGWHLPSDDDFQILIAFVGGEDSAGVVLKSTNGWMHDNRDANGVDRFGFAALPAGKGYKGKYSSMLESTYYRLLNGGCLYLHSAHVDECGDNSAYSVRCLKGNVREEKASAYGTLVDERDGKTYKTVKIGSQTWMAENLNYYDGVELNREGKKRSWCYNDEPDSCAKYGRIYRWSVAIDSAGTFSEMAKGCGEGNQCKITTLPRGVCPEGWHIPVVAEWETLYSVMGESPYAMQKKGFEKWPEANDAYGFSVIPAGYKGKGFYGFGSEAVFWSVADDGCRGFWHVDADKAKFDSYSGEGDGYVRCLKDSP